MITPPGNRDANKVMLSQDYAITLTLSPHLYDKDTLSQSIAARKCFEFCVSGLQNAKISAFMEETKTFNIHIHAIMSVQMTDYVKRFGATRFITNVFRNKNWGKIKDISPVANYDAWCKYISKDVKTVEREYYPIIRDDYDIMAMPKDRSDAIDPIIE